jgi:hypothetical protein
MELVRNLKMATNILNKICKENGIDPENVYINESYSYVETVNVNKKDADYCTTDYRGQLYEVQYLSGCFNPFIVRVN